MFYYSFYCKSEDSSSERPGFKSRNSHISGVYPVLPSQLIHYGNIKRGQSSASTPYILVIVRHMILLLLSQRDANCGLPKKWLSVGSAPQTQTRGPKRCSWLVSTLGHEFEAVDLKLADVNPGFLRAWIFLNNSFATSKNGLSLIELRSRRPSRKLDE